MKRLFALLLCLVLLTALAACGGTAPASADSDALSVVVTIFPLYDWVRQLCRGVDGVDVTLLMDSGVDMHSFQPSAADMVLLSSCDLFIYVGGESDAWAADALAEAVNPELSALDLLSLLGDRAVTEELVEGMTGELEEEPEPDEHLWLSLRNAELCCAAIADVLAALDPANAAIYAGNLADYTAELAALDDEFAAVADGAAHDTLLFADRFPFRYLTEDYGLTYYAAFAGCSAETEASFETVAFLAGKLNDLALPAVLVIDGSDGRIADTVIASAGADVPVLTLDSMQSVDAADIAAGETYLGIMGQNLTALAAALNG